MAYSVVTAFHTIWITARSERLGLFWVSILDKALVNKDLEVSEDGRSLPICALACRWRAHLRHRSNILQGNEGERCQALFFGDSCNEGIMKNMVIGLAFFHLKRANDFPVIFNTTPYILLAGH